MDYLCPKDRRLKLFEDLRPLTADRTHNARSKTKSPKNSARRSSRPTTARPESAHSDWGSNKPKTLAPINISREISKSRRILGTAEKTDFSVVNKIGAPGGHIARMEADKRGERSPTKSSGLKMFCFSENIDDLLSYNTKESNEDVPDWEPRFICDHIERAAKAKEKRQQKRAHLRSLNMGLNAINVTMHDIVSMYTTAHAEGSLTGATVETPIHLNDDEAHVWQKLRASLYNCGQQFTHKAMDEIAARHRDPESVANNNPIFTHFLQYMNIVLGGTNSLASAKVILLKDLSYLLKLIQDVCVYPLCIYLGHLVLIRCGILSLQIDLFKLPLDSLREATAFRMREMTRIGQLLQAQYQSNDLGSVSSTESEDTGSLNQRSTVFSNVDENSVRMKMAAANKFYSQVSRSDHCCIECMCSQIYSNISALLLFHLETAGCSRSVSWPRSH
jgi:hypothetical protein